MYCVFCVLFSTKTDPRKFHTLPEQDWSNVHRTTRKHSKLPEQQAGKKTSDHMLCSQKATDFTTVFEGMRTPISEQLNEQRKMQVASNRHIMISILKLIHGLGKQNLAIRGKNDDRSRFNVS